MEADEAQFKLAFATTLVGLRAERAIGSLAQLARLVGVSQTTVQRWEDTQRPHMPSTWELRRLAEVLGVEASELIYPAELNDRERQLARRAARAVRSEIAPKRRASGGRA